MIQIEHQNKIYNIDISNVKYYKLREKIKDAVIYDKDTLFIDHDLKSIDKKLNFSIRQINNNVFEIQFRHRISILYMLLHLLKIDWIFY